MLRARVGVALVVAMGCSGPPPAPSAASSPAAAPSDAPPSPASPPAATPSNEADEMIEGTIRAIELHNINKARDHYTYNVELVVERADGSTMRVRVDKIFWGGLSASQQQALAPGGPAHVLKPERYESWSVGDAVSLSVELTSPDLGYLRR